MPTLGPSISFVAGSTLGVGAGALFPRKKEQQVPVPVSVPAQSLPGNVPFPVPVERPGAGHEEKRLVVPIAGSTVTLAGGFPGPHFDIIRRQAYMAAYDRRLRHPAWTAEHLTAKSLSRPPPNFHGGPPVPADKARAADTAGPKADRQKSQFQEDMSVPEMFRAKLSDYFRSGYDRGHMVPAADAKISQDAMDETFFSTNIAPQVGEGFNRHYWAYVEDFCRRSTSNFEDVYVFTIPLYLPEQGKDGKWRVSYEVIGNPPSVAVPTHFAKVVLASRPDFSYPQTPNKHDKSVTSPETVKELAMGAFILPNKEIPDGADSRTFIAPVDKVEKAAGLQLFNDELKGKSRQLCAVTQCDVIVRRFDDARKNFNNKKN